MRFYDGRCRVIGPYRNVCTLSRYHLGKHEGIGGWKWPRFLVNNRGREIRDYRRKL
jgi:hypothetical protein